MSKKRIRNTRKELVILIVIVAALCMFLILRSNNNDRRENKTEQKNAEIPQETFEIETVFLKDDDAASILQHALELALSDTENSMDKAIIELSKSAKLGNSDAMYFLGELYFQGIGVEADLGKAGMYFRQACENGNRKAMSIYGKMLFLGEGTVQNYDESASYFYTLSKDDGEASYILGVMSNLGIGVPRSAERAKKYINQAAELGYEKAEAYHDMIDNMDKTIAGTQEFTLQAKKVKELDYGAEYEDLQSRIDQYQNVIKATENYSAFEDEMTGLLDIDINGIRMSTLFGNNGYLFYQNENDETSVHDYIGDNHFTQKEMEDIAAKLEQEKRWVEQNGSKFVLLLIPDKETMYPEWMPSYINRIDTTTREDQLAEYLRKNTDINVVYVKDTLMQNKELYPLYYKTDTHANMVGSLFMVSDLLKDCYGMEIAFDLDKFDIHVQNYMGDLGMMAKCTDRYANDIVYFYPERAVGDEEKLNSSIMLVGESFSEFINIEIGYYLRGGVDHRIITEYDLDYHSATQAGFDSMQSESMNPEYVVWECVERCLDFLK